MTASSQASFVSKLTRAVFILFDFDILNVVAHHVVALALEGEFALAGRVGLTLVL